MPINQLGVDPFLLRGGHLPVQQKRGGIVGNRPAVPTQESMYAQQQVQQQVQQRSQQFAQSYATREQRRVRTAETKERRRQQAAAQAERQQDREAQQQRDMFQAQSQYGLQERRLGAAATEAEAGRQFTTGRDRQQREAQLGYLREQHLNRIDELDIIAQDRSLSARETAAIQEERDERIASIQEQDRILSSNLRGDEAARGRSEEFMYGISRLEAINRMDIPESRKQEMRLADEITSGQDWQNNQNRRGLVKLGAELSDQSDKRRIALNEAVGIRTRKDVAGHARDRDILVSQLGLEADDVRNLNAIDRQYIAEDIQNNLDLKRMHITKELTMYQQGISMEEILFRAGLKSEETRQAFVNDIYLSELTNAQRMEVLDANGEWGIINADRNSTNHIKRLVKQNRLERANEVHKETKETNGNIWNNEGYAAEYASINAAKKNGVYNGRPNLYADDLRSMYKRYQEDINNDQMRSANSPGNMSMRDRVKRGSHTDSTGTYLSPGLSHTPTRPAQKGLGIYEGVADDFNKSLTVWNSLGPEDPDRGEKPTLLNFLNQRKQIDDFMKSGGVTDETEDETEDETGTGTDPSAAVNTGGVWEGMKGAAMGGTIGGLVSPALALPGAVVGGVQGFMGDEPAPAPAPPKPTPKKKFIEPFAEKSSSHAAIRDHFTQSSRTRIAEAVEGFKSGELGTAADYKKNGPAMFEDNFAALGAQIAFDGINSIKVYKGPNQSPGVMTGPRMSPGEVYFSWDAANQKYELWRAHSKPIKEPKKKY